MLLHTTIVHAKFHALTHSFREIISLTFFSKDLYKVAILSHDSHMMYESTEVETLGAVLHVKCAALPCICAHEHCVLT